MDYFGYSIFSWPVDGIVVAFFVYRADWPRLIYEIEMPFKQATLSLLSLCYFIFGTSFSSFVKMFSAPLWLFTTYFFYQIFSFLVPILFVWLIKYSEVRHLKRRGCQEMIFMKGETSVLLLSFVMGLGEDLVSIVILCFALFQTAREIRKPSVREYVERAGVLVEEVERSFWRNLALGERHHGGRFHVAFLALAFNFFFGLSMMDITSRTQFVVMTLNVWMLIVIYLIVRNRWSLRKGKPPLLLPAALIFSLMIIEGSLNALPVAAFYSQTFFTGNIRVYGETLFGMPSIMLLLVGAIWPLKSRGTPPLIAPDMSRLGIPREALKTTSRLLIFVFFSLSYFIISMFALPKIENGNMRVAITIALVWFYVWLVLYKELIPAP